ncbi:AAA family ATPase [Pontiellaceae bacterium B1224]|nr:AAA family ATPase [Pontiellaceae bacterium B1224]
MKLVSLQMCNFRQFYGETPLIRFATDNQNVTVIHAENGAGKTALLNAFTWLLYDSHTKGFGSPEEKVNKRALAEADIGSTVEAWVKLSFEHNGTLYEIRRQSDAIKVSDTEWSLKPERSAQLLYAGEDGQWLPEEKVTEAIGRILPKDLHTYFFFDGERIERIVMPTKKEKADLAAATKKLLGVEVLDRAITHLNDARGALEKELKRIGDPETLLLLDQKEAKESEQEDLESELDQLQTNVDGLIESKTEVENRLRALEGVQDLQKRRDQLNDDLDARKASLGQTQEKLKQAIAKDGFAVFVEDVADDFRELIESLRKKGELPVGIKKRFVQDILDQASCICGRPLDAEDAPAARAAVEAWMQKAGSDDVEKAANEMGILIDSMQEKVPTFWDTISNAQSKEGTDRTEISEIEGELDDIKKKLEGSPREEVSSLQSRLSKLEEDITQTNKDIGATDVNIKGVSAEIAELQEKIAKHKGLEDQQNLANRRVNAAVDARDRIKQVYENLNERLRKKLEESINKYFHQISVSPYVAKLDSAYSLELFDESINVPIPVARSQGESQVLCLSFIAGFVDLAREWSAQRGENLAGPDSAEYPIVMDSPFGALDTTNRRHVTEHINRVADQVVMMVSSTQWRGEVSGASAGKVGKSYVLSYHTPNDDLDDKVSVDLNGQMYDLVRKSPNEFEYTEVIEVEHG